VRRRLAVLLYSAAALAYVLDRVTKVLAEARLQGRAPIVIIPGVFELRFTTNPGGAFGLFGGAAWLFVLASVVVIVAVVASSWNLPSGLAAISLGLVLGGALGNLTDRVLRGPGFSGEVVDFLDFQIWPVFNLADSAIVVGAALLLLSTFRKEPAIREGASGAERGPPRSRATSD
jgi:signal peptidase II